jgi:putative ABC transport system ATP-binding protein
MKEAHSLDILRVEKLTKTYGSGEAKVRALDNVSFTAEKGEFIAVMGPSGSGKSTLLHILGGVDRPTSGRVLIEGTDIYALNETKLAIFRRRQIGLIYQFYNLIPVLDAEENITLPLLLDERKQDRRQLSELLATLNLGDRAKYLPNQLSGGQQQRVSIGRALINNPALMLADEPTGNLDSANSADIIRLLRLSNQRYNQTLILITHDQSIALQADRIICLEDGRITRDEVIRK